jgi:hypothetical protein
MKTCRFIDQYRFKNMGCFCLLSNTKPTKYRAEYIGVKFDLASDVAQTAHRGA